MATGGVTANGSKVGFSASSPLSFTRIAQLLDITKFLELIADKLDTTVHSTSNIRTAAPGMIAVPEVELMLLADLDQASSPSHETMRKYAAGSGDPTAGTTIYFRIEVPVNRAQSSFRAWEFQAYVSGWVPDAKLASLVTIKAVLVFAGGYTIYNAGASIIP